ncbi:MAG: hypothetical protein LBD75_00145 [Candidatus Peribacteria bacterium]|nr:hypothetical protein [Candidatus Peribacteria bacterium]
MSSEDFKEEEDEEEGEKSNFELELLSAIRTANDELYALASEGVDDKNYLKMKSNSPVSDYPFVA